MGKYAFNLGSVDHLLDFLFSFIDVDYKRLIIPDKQSHNQETLRISVVAAMRSKLHVYFQSLLLNSGMKRGILREAAVAGDLDLFKWAHIHAGLAVSKADLCAWATEGGKLEILQWAVANGCTMDINTCHSAAEAGRLDLLQWARANGAEWDNKGSW
jgi:hypothetical protein